MALHPFYIIVPQGTRNLFPYPSFEAAAAGDTTHTGFTAISSSTLLVDDSDSFKGVQSLKITPNTAADAGFYYGTIATTSGTPYTLSLRVKGTAGKSWTFAISTTGGSHLAYTTVSLTGDWQFVEVFYGQETSSTTRRLYFVKNSASGDVSPIWIDCVQVEELPYSTTYCDGDQPGCRWIGGGPKNVHRTMSERSSDWRKGGRKVYFDTYGAYLVDQAGSGMAPIKSISQAYGSGDGSFFQGQQATERQFTVTFSLAGDGMPQFHDRRQELINLMKPDLVYPVQEFIIGYSDGGDDIEISCHYDSGMQLTGGKVDIEALPIQLIASTPYWTKNRDRCYKIGAPYQTFSATQWAHTLSDTGDWAVMGGTGPNGQIDCVIRDVDGTWLVGGRFTSCNSVANTGYLARYDPVADSWSSVGTFNARVRCIILDVVDNGPIVGGDFTTIDGNSRPYLAKYIGGSWKRPHATDAPNAYVSCLAQSDVSLYWHIWGNFTSFGGSAPTRYGQYFPAGSDGLSGIYSAPVDTYSAAPTDCAFDRNAQIVYLIGPFVTVSGNTVNGLFYHNFSGTSGTISRADFNDGTTTVPDAICLDRDGHLILVNRNNSGNSDRGVYMWDGAAWTTINSTTISNGPLDFIVRNPINDHLYAGTASLTALYRFVSGSCVLYPTRAWPLRVFFDDNGNSIWAYNAAGAGATYRQQSKSFTLTNYGDTIAHPRIVMKGPKTQPASFGTTQSMAFGHLANFRTGQYVFGPNTFDLSFLHYYVFSGETVTIDTEGGVVKSDIRKNALYLVQQISDMGSFSLMPGNNKMEFFGAPSDSTISYLVYLLWQERYWSIDAGTPNS